MPLTLELYGSSPDSHGHVIIDRKNLIFIYSNGDSKHSRKIAATNRNRIADAIDANTYLYPFFSSKKNYAAISDPRHDVLEHMCEYDRYRCMHYHIFFEDDVNLDHIKLVFCNLPMDNLSDLISEKCRKNILKITEKYFYDLKHSETAIKIEEEYIYQKENELKIAKEIAANQDALINNTSILNYVIPIIFKLFGVPASIFQTPMTFFNSTQKNDSQRILELPDIEKIGLVKNRSN